MSLICWKHSAIVFPLATVKDKSLVKLYFGELPFEAGWQKENRQIYCTANTAKIWIKVRQISSIRQTKVQSNFYFFRWNVRIVPPLLYLKVKANICILKILKS